MEEVQEPPLIVPFEDHFHGGVCLHPAAPRHPHHPKQIDRQRLYPDIHPFIGLEKRERQKGAQALPVLIENHRRPARPFAGR